MSKVVIRVALVLIAGALGAAIVLVFGIASFGELMTSPYIYTFGGLLAAELAWEAYQERHNNRKN